MVELIPGMGEQLVVLAERHSAGQSMTSDKSTIDIACWAQEVVVLGEGEQQLVPEDDHQHPHQQQNEEDDHPAFTGPGQEEHRVPVKEQTGKDITIQSSKLSVLGTFEKTVVAGAQHGQQGGGGHDVQGGDPLLQRDEVVRERDGQVQGVHRGSNPQTDRRASDPTHTPTPTMPTPKRKRSPENKIQMKIPRLSLPTKPQIYEFPNKEKIPKPTPT
jgi:hypothetical protein